MTYVNLLIYLIIITCTVLIFEDYIHISFWIYDRKLKYLEEKLTNLGHKFNTTIGDQFVADSIEFLNDYSIPNCVEDSYRLLNDLFNELQIFI